MLNSTIPPQQPVMSLNVRLARSCNKRTERSKRGATLTETVSSAPTAQFTEHDAREEELALWRDILPQQPQIPEPIIEDDLLMVTETPFVSFADETSTESEDPSFSNEFVTAEEFTEEEESIVDRIDDMVLHHRPKRIPRSLKVRLGIYFDLEESQLPLPPNNRMARWAREMCPNDDRYESIPTYGFPLLRDFAVSKDDEIQAKKIWSRVGLGEFNIYYLRQAFRMFGKLLYDGMWYKARTSAQSIPYFKDAKRKIRILLDGGRLQRLDLVKRVVRKAKSSALRTFMRNYKFLLKLFSGKSEDKVTRYLDHFYSEQNVWMQNKDEPDEDEAWQFGSLLKRVSSFAKTTKKKIAEVPTSLADKASAGVSDAISKTFMSLLKKTFTDLQKSCISGIGSSISSLKKWVVYLKDLLVSFMKEFANMAGSMFDTMAESAGDKFKIFGSVALAVFVMYTWTWWKSQVGFTILLSIVSFGLTAVGMDVSPEFCSAWDSLTDVTEHAEFQNKHEDYMSKIAKIFLGLFSLGTIGSVTGIISRMPSVINNSKDFFMWFVDGVYYLFTGKKYYFADFEEVDSFKVYMEKAIAFLLLPDVRNRCMIDEVLARQCMVLGREVGSMSLICAKLTGITASTRNYYVKMLEHLRTMNLEVTARSIVTQNRIEPVVVSLYGKPGEGKSKAMEFLPKMIYDKVRHALPEQFPYSWHPNMEFTKSRDQAYCDEYDPVRSFAWTCEEFCALGDIQERGMEIVEFLTMVSSKPKPLTSAKIDQKNNLFFASPLILQTSNLTDGDLDAKNGVTDVKAYYRRRHFRMECVRKRKIRSERLHKEFDDAWSFVIHNDINKEEVIKQAVSDTPINFKRLKEKGSLHYNITELANMAAQTIVNRYKMRQTCVQEFLDGDYGGNGGPEPPPSKDDPPPPPVMNQETTQPLTFMERLKSWFEELAQVEDEKIKEELIVMSITDPEEYEREVDEAEPTQSAEFSYEAFVQSDFWLAYVNDPTDVMHDCLKQFTTVELEGIHKVHCFWMNSRLDSDPSTNTFDKKVDLCIEEMDAKEQDGAFTDRDKRFFDLRFGTKLCAFALNERVRRRSFAEQKEEKKVRTVMSESLPTRVRDRMIDDIAYQALVRDGLRHPYAASHFQRCLYAYGESILKISLGLDGIEWTKDEFINLTVPLSKRVQTEKRPIKKKNAARTKFEPDIPKVVDDRPVTTAVEKAVMKFVPSGQATTTSTTVVKDEAKYQNDDEPVKKKFTEQAWLNWQVCKAKVQRFYEAETVKTSRDKGWFSRFGKIWNWKTDYYPVDEEVANNSNLEQMSSMADPADMDIWLRTKPACWLTDKMDMPVAMNKFFIRFVNPDRKKRRDLYNDCLKILSSALYRHDITVKKRFAWLADSVNMICKYEDDIKRMGIFFRVFVKAYKRFKNSVVQPVASSNVATPGCEQHVYIDRIIWMNQNWQQAIVAARYRPNREIEAKEAIPKDKEWSYRWCYQVCKTELPKDTCAYLACNVRDKVSTLWQEIKTGVCGFFYKHGMLIALVLGSLLALACTVVGIGAPIAIVMNHHRLTTVLIEKASENEADMQSSSRGHMAKMNKIKVSYHNDNEIELLETKEDDETILTIKTFAEKAYSSLSEKAKVEFQNKFTDSLDRQVAKISGNMRTLHFYYKNEGRMCEALISGRRVYMNKHYFACWGTDFDTLEIVNGDEACVTLSKHEVQIYLDPTNRDYACFDLPNNVNALPSLKRYMVEKNNYENQLGKHEVARIHRLSTGGRVTHRYALGKGTARGVVKTYQTKLAGDIPYELHLGSHIVTTGLESESGMCGLPYMTVDHTGVVKVLGLHCAVVGEQSVFFPLYKEDDEADRVAYQTGTRVVYRQGIYTPPCVRDLSNEHRQPFDGRLVSLGRVTKGDFMPTETKIIASVFQESAELPAVHPVECAPAMLKPMTVETDDLSTPVVVRPLYKGIAKMCSYRVRTFPKFISHMFQHDPATIFRGFFPVTRKEFKLLTLEEAVMKLDMSTSVGFDFKVEGYSKREDLWNKETGWINPLLRARVKELFVAMDCGYELKNVVSACLKDETRDLERVYAGKTRIFCVGSLAHLLVTVMVMGDVVDFMKSNRIDTDVCIGVNPHGPEWSVLAEKLQRYKNTGGGDFSGFDTSIAMKFGFGLYLAMRWYMQIRDQRMLWYVYNVCMSSVAPYMVINDQVYWMDWMNSSGGWLTGFLNSFVNVVIFNSFFWYICKENELGDHDRLQHLVCCFYGDDNLWSVSDMFKKYVTMTALSDYITNAFGMMYTTPSKGEIDQDFIPFEELEFLCRKFKKRGNIYNAPLALSSVHGMLLWIRKSSIRTPLDQLAVNVEQAMMEMYHHGPEAFYEEERLLMKYCSHYGVSYTGLTYDEYHSRWCTGMLCPSDGVCC